MLERWGGIRSCKKLFSSGLEKPHGTEGLRPAPCGNHKNMDETIRNGRQLWFVRRPARPVFRPPWGNGGKGNSHYYKMTGQGNLVEE